jgi:hypothetical protein
MKVLLQRTAMIGGGYSYDAYVSSKEVATYDPCRYVNYHLSHSPRGVYLSLCDATMPEEHYSMPKGWERYEAYMAHEKESKKLALTLARRVFPELDYFEGDELPFLWLNDLPEGKQAGHMAVTVEI